MEVEVKPVYLSKETRFGTVKQRSGLDEVWVNGALAGHVPHEEKDDFFGVFHPLSGFPAEMLPDVVDKCKEITGTLATPHVPQLEDDEDSDE
jgi:hypothetical protein